MSNSERNNAMFTPTLEQHVLLHLLATALGVSCAPLTEAECREVDWEWVMQESIHQTVSSLAFDAAFAYSDYIPSTVYERWLEITYANLRRAHGTFRSQQHLTRRMAENGLACIILKGSAAAAYYPQPEQRCFGDVDFLIDPTQRTAVEAMLTADGYERWQAEHICHVVYRKKSENLEMHFEVAGIPYGEVGEWVRNWMHGAVCRPLLQTVGGSEFPAPQPRYHALILLLHMQHHMLGEGLGLRHLCDWTAFVTRTKDEPFWTCDVLPFLDKIGLLTYAVAMTKLGAIYLHAPCPSWAEMFDESVCGALMEDILLGGNFGRKDKRRAASSMLISEHGKAGTRHGMLYNLAHTLHSAVLLQYPIIRRVPILYPFIYGYKAMRFCILRLMGKRPSLLAAVPAAGVRRNLYAQLKIFEIQSE